MAILRTVYFCESDPSKWFENMKDAEQFDKAAEVAEYVDKEIVVNSPYARKIIDCILDRYEITERYDYVRPAEDVQE